MAKIDKSEFLKNVRSIINEGLNPQEEFDATEKFSIKRYVNQLITEGSRNPNLMSVLVNYDNRIKHGEPEYMMFESFGYDISRYASGNKNIKGIIAEMNNTLKNSGNQLETFMVLESIDDESAKETIREAYNTYLNEQDETSKNNLIDSLVILNGNNSRQAERLNCLIAESTLVSSKEIPMNLNENEYNELNKEMIKDKEQKKMKDIQNKIMEYASEYFDNAIAEQKVDESKNTLHAIANNTGVNLRKAVNYIANSNANSNAALMEHVNQYANALQNGLYEERLYESFLNTMSQYTYMAPVEKAIKMVNENVKKNELGITITKVLEEMSETMSYYIVPIIEEDCARFVNNPTPTNRVQMRNAIMPFAADPYVNFLLNEIESDDVPGMKSLSEKAMTVKDQIKLIRENASVSNIYSPIQFIKENECVFNVNGEYFVKKGNSIMKFNDKYIDKLSEKFVSLCQLCNDPRVAINEDVIYLNSGNKVAEIHEGYVDINGIRESKDSLRNLHEMCNKYDYDTNFFIMASCLHENFNNIAKVGFAKHISLNKNANVYADLFRINDNIFINTVNEQLSQNIFYKNVNPIQCKNIINKHMGLNVSNLFEDLLPSQNKILLRLNETQNEYESAITEYEETIEELESAKTECKDDSNKEKLDKAIKEAKSKLESLKKEYKNWQKEAKKATGDDSKEDVDDEETSDDGATREETTDEPLKTDKEVDDAMPELTTPITGDADEDDLEDLDDLDVEDDEEGDFTSPTDDEFADMLNDTDEDDFDDTELDATDDTELDDIEDGDVEDNDVDIDDTDLDDIDDDSDIDDVDMDDEEDTLPEIDIDDTDLDDTDNDDADVEDDIDDVDIDDTDLDDTAVDNDIDDEDIYDTDFEDDDADAATDMFGGNVDDPLNNNAEIEDFEDDEEEIGNAWEISQIRFDENLKTGVKYKSGSVTVITPMISRTGETYMESENYEFYLDDETGEPVINNDEMEVTLYKQIIAAIKDSDEYQDFVDNGDVNPYINSEDFFGGKSEEDFIDTDEDETEEDDELSDINDLFDFTDDDDEFSISAKEDTDDSEDDDIDIDDADDDDSDIDIDDIFGDDEEPLAKIPLKKKAVKRASAPTYKSGDTDIELPSSDIDDTLIPESRMYRNSRRSMNENRNKIIGLKPKFRR